MKFAEIRVEYSMTSRVKQMLANVALILLLTMLGDVTVGVLWVVYGLAK